MDRDKLKDFTVRITQANPTQLVVITYEIIIEYIDCAMLALEDNDEAEFVKNCRKARQFVNELTSALDFSKDISKELLSLYIYANNCIFKSEIRRKNVHLEVIRDMMNKLRSSFEIISREDTSGKMMTNVQQVYEGLTYGRNARNMVNVTGREYRDAGFIYKQDYIN